MTTAKRRRDQSSSSSARWHPCRAVVEVRTDTSACAGMFVTTDKVTTLRQSLLSAAPPGLQGLGWLGWALGLAGNWEIDIRKPGTRELFPFALRTGSGSGPRAKSSQAKKYAPNT